MSQKKIGFIGAGNMGQALIQGLIQAGYDPAGIIVSDTDTSRVEELAKTYKLTAAPHNRWIGKNADMVVLAVKPQQIHAVADDIAGTLAQEALVVSIAAGVTTASLKTYLGHNTAVVRCMPNTPALVHAGISALFACPDVQAAQKEWAESVLNSVGRCVWIEQENQMDAVTALSGSGPAYFFYMMEWLIEGGKQLGLNHTQATQLCLHTAFGAAKMALDSTDDVATLRKKVTSPGGTTAAALDVFTTRHMHSTLCDALAAAKQRSEELAQISGDSK